MSRAARDPGDRAAHLQWSDEEATAWIVRGRTLGLRVAAEGIETREQLEFLERRGCHEAQGSYFSPAVDAGSFALLMQDAKLLPAAKPAALA